MFALPQSAPCREVIKQCSLYLSLYHVGNVIKQCSLYLSLHHDASLLTQLGDDVADTDVKIT